MAFNLGDSVAHKSAPTIKLIVTATPIELEGVLVGKYEVTRFCDANSACKTSYCIEEELMEYVAP